MTRIEIEAFTRDMVTSIVGVNPEWRNSDYNTATWCYLDASKEQQELMYRGISILGISSLLRRSFAIGPTGNVSAYVEIRNETRLIVEVEFGYVDYEKEE
jgi:hypothetical protein